MREAMNRRPGDPEKQALQKAEERLGSACKQGTELDTAAVYGELNFTREEVVSSQNHGAVDKHGAVSVHDPSKRASTFDSIHATDRGRRTRPTTSPLRVDEINMNQFVSTLFQQLQNTVSCSTSSIGCATTLAEEMIPEFHGFKNDPTTWVSAVKDVAARHSWPDHMMKSFAEGRLQGAAEAWNRFKGSAYVTWSAWSAALTSVFAPLPSTYDTQFMEMRCNIEWTSPAARQYVVDGLYDPTHAAILSAQSFQDDLETFVRRATPTLNKSRRVHDVDALRAGLLVTDIRAAHKCPAKPSSTKPGRFPLLRSASTALGCLRRSSILEPSARPYFDATPQPASCRGPSRP
ncbi:hypothetical protein HPB50_028744 [Hyalomma asiaticum]|nr:hypothetical protein HPB50_028744 [Hyalomma asiaticum]